MICKIVRGKRGVLGLPPIVIPFLAARMLAGNITISKNAKPTEAKLEVKGINRTMAPAISHIPVMVTMTPGFGRAGGTILIRSGRLFPQ